MTILERLVLILKTIVVLRRRLMYQAAVNYLGTDASPLDLVDDVVGCAESVSHVIRKVFPNFPVIVGTWTLEQRLWSDKRFQITQSPQPGDIIISSTGSSKKGNKAPFRGHVGIVGQNGLVLSNNSFTGLWSAHYTLDRWQEHYGKRGGYPVNYYTIVDPI